jgi:iron complex transport system ATP-binding protein
MAVKMAGVTVIDGPKDETDQALVESDADEVLAVRGLSAGYHKKTVVHDISFTVRKGSFVCVIGANGCGKTTVLKAVLGMLEHVSGAVMVCGKDAREMSVRDRARHFAYIPQLHVPPFPFKVCDVVLMGRTPHLRSSVASVSKDDMRTAWAAMRQMGIEQLANCVYSQLSGGQQQLVLIARALAQEPAILVMDEPTASLDFGNQQLVLSQLRKLTCSGASVLMVTHDPDHALYCSDKVIVMEDGGILADGPSSETITTGTLRRIYGTDVHVIDVSLEDGTRTRACIPAIT